MRCGLAVVRVCVVVFAIVAASSSLAQRRRAVDHPSLPVTDLTFAEGGYTGNPSVVQGGTVEFHLASALPSVDLQIFNRADPETPLMTISGLATKPRNCTGLYATGCGWPVTTAIAIPFTWRSGIYAAKFQTSQGSRYVPFVVRQANPGSTSPILIVSGTNTFQAYNDFGGKSVYPTGSPLRSFKVSFDRPYDDDAGMGLVRVWEEPFLKWLASKNYVVEWATNGDLADPAFLGHYKEIVLPGHHEYWTLAERHGVEQFSAGGGHIAVFGGNTMWWQARLEDNGRTLVVYKDATPDPLTLTNPPLVTVNWYDWPVYNPENFVLGASFRNGGYVNVDANLNSAPKTTGFTVTDPTLWFLSGIAAAKGQPFGTASTGSEADGVLYNCLQEGLVAETSDGSPSNFHIAAITPASLGHGTIGYFVNSAGGAVFNAGTRDWVLGLTADPVVQQITTNVLDRFATGQRFVYDATPNPYRMRELFNCPKDAGSLEFPGWHGTIGNAQLSADCAYEGPYGIKLGGTSNVAMFRNFTPDGVGLKHAEVRFYLNADAVSRPKDSTLTTLSLTQRIDRTTTRDLLQFQIAIASSGKVARLIQLRGDAPGAEGSTANVPLASGWNAIQVTWNAPGVIALQVGNAAPVTIQNAHTDQWLNELTLNYRVLAGTSDSTCVDAIGLGDQKLPDVPAIRF